MSLRSDEPSGQPERRINRFVNAMPKGRCRGYPRRSSADKESLAPVSSAEELKQTLPLTMLPGVTSALACRVELAETQYEADFSTIHGHNFRVLKSFALSESELRLVWDRLLGCRLGRPCEAKKTRTDLALQLFSDGEWVGVAEVKWDGNTILLLIDGYFCVPMFDADAPEAQSIRRMFDERLN